MRKRHWRKRNGVQRTPKHLHDEACHGDPIPRDRRCVRQRRPLQYLFSCSRLGWRIPNPLQRVVDECDSEFNADPNAIRAILITQLHGDHFGGLPYFILDAQLVSRRTTPLIVAGPPGLHKRLSVAMENAFPGPTKVERRFRVDVRELEPRLAHEVAGVVVTPFVVKHACGARPALCAAHRRRQQDTLLFRRH